MGQLPGDADNNLRLLMALNSQLDSSTQTLNRAQQDKTYTETLLAQQLAAWKSSQSSTNPQTLEAATECTAGAVDATAGALYGRSPGCNQDQGRYRGDQEETGGNERCRQQRDRHHQQGETFPSRPRFASFACSFTSTTT